MTPSTGSTPKGRIRHHREILAAARDAAPEERRELLETALQETRSRRRNRPLPRWLARRANRRALAAIAVVPFVCGAASAYMTPGSLPASLVQLVGAAGVLAGLSLLRRATRELTEVPDAELDERELEERNKALGTAYLALVTCLAVVGLLALADGPLLSTADWKPLILGTFGTAILLPAAAAAWKWHDLDDES